jgi:hypothetical protein
MSRGESAPDELDSYVRLCVGPASLAQLFGAHDRNADGRVFAAGVDASMTLAELKAGETTF